MMGMFIVWSIVGCLFIGVGIYAFFAKKAIGFWANAEMFKVTDIKKYNGAVARLFCVYGIVFTALGFPLLSGQNATWILFSVLGMVIESITAMIVYTTVIERKYKKN